jgi:hypothetical protein
MAKLYINEGGKEAVYELFDDSPEVTVGRGASNAIQIADGHASKVHFVLRRVRGRWKAIDLESKNGTRVNGAFKNSHWLAQNDALTVGSVVLRFDAEGEPAGAPPRAAVPVAAAARPVAPAARAAVPAVPVARAAAPAVPAAPAARPAPLARPAPAVAMRAAAPVAAPMAAAPAPAPARAAPRRQREEEYDDEDGEEGERFQPRKTGLSGGVLALLLGLGVVLIALVLNIVLSSNTNVNGDVRKKIKQFRDAGRYDEALQVAKTEGVAGEAGWQQVQEEIQDLEGLIAQRAVSARWAEAKAWHKKNLERWIATGGSGPGSWNPKDAISEKEAAQRLREFLRLYGDTSIAKEVVNGKDGTNTVYQRILRENQDPARTAKIAFDEVDAQIAPLVNAGRLGAAHALLTLATQVERLNLPAAEYTTFESRARERQGVLKLTAIEQLDRALNEGGSLAKRGERGMGKATVDTVLKRLAWPETDLQRRADEAMRAW